MPVKFKSPIVDAAPSDQPLKEGSGDLDHQQLLVVKNFAQNHVMYHAHKNTAGETAPRHHNVVHASDLDPARQWCPREPALLTTHNKKRPPGFLSTAQKTVFDFGHSGAEILRRQLPPEIVWGNWQCLGCKTQWKHCYTPTCDCGAHKRAMEYREVFMRDPESGVVGSSDLLVDLLRNGVKTIVETKTEGGSDWKKRSKPEFDHNWRTVLYVWLSQVTPWLKPFKINPHDARVVYINKEGFDAEPRIKKWGIPDWPKSPYKEYIVNREDSFFANQMAKANAYRKWRNGWDIGATDQSLPDRICGSPTETRAKNCAVCKECFG